MSEDDDNLEAQRRAYSGVERALGYRRTDWAEDGACIELDLDDRHNNIADRVHGGIYAMLIDDATGFAVCWNAERERRRPGVTLSLTVDFLGAPTTQRVIAKGWRTGGGRSISFAEAEVRDAKGVLLATGRAVYKHQKPKGDAAGG